jgi:rRNA processing protein Krr1/Pno1
MDGLIVKLDELKKRVREVLKKRRALERVVGRKGYSLKSIKKNVYVYVWEYEDGQVRWKCLGNVNKVGLPEGVSEELLKKIEKIDAVLREVERHLDEAMKLLP